MSPKWLKKPIKGVLLDISGVLKDYKEAIQESVFAFETLQKLGIPYRLVTNETTETKAQLVKSLRNMGFNVYEKDILSPVPVMINIIRENKLKPHLLVADEILEEFNIENDENKDCVVISDAGPNLNYEKMNEAFRLLINMPEPKLFSLGMGKYYKGDNGLNLDVGAFTKALEYATGVNAIPVGKPTPEFFLTAVNDMKLKPEDVVMIGDDIESDVKGAQACGIRGVLVKTGKYRSSDGGELIADGVVTNLNEGIQLIKNTIS
uniref:Phospholysine phosphohistidine inorganic pyrophosphate phosphatase n=2 Tax=Clastoptera arizonana TaxID=38151 RepID=A0A1B6ECQ2_9HEMI